MVLLLRFIFEDIYSVLKEMKFMKLTGITKKKLAIMNNFETDFIPANLDYEIKKMFYVKLHHLCILKL